MKNLILPWKAIFLYLIVFFLTIMIWNPIFDVLFSNTDSKLTFLNGLNFFERIAFFEKITYLLHSVFCGLLFFLIHKYLKKDYKILKVMSKVSIFVSCILLVYIIFMGLVFLVA